MHTSARSAFLHCSRTTSSTSRTAVYGPVRTVVWQGSAGDCAPMPIKRDFEYVWSAALPQVKSESSRYDLRVTCLPLPLLAGGIYRKRLFGQFKRLPAPNATIRTPRPTKHYSLSFTLGSPGGHNGTQALSHFLSLCRFGCSTFPFPVRYSYKQDARTFLFRPYQPSLPS
jgi:hypothetical protein